MKQHQQKKKLKNEADRLLQQKYVPINPICAVCGGTTSEMHHYIPKKQSLALRYDPLNLVPLCRSCHARHHLSGDPKIVACIIRKYGFEWEGDLQVRRHALVKDNLEYYEQILAELEG